MVELRETGSHSGGRLVAFHFPVPLPFFFHRDTIIAEERL